MCCLSLAFRYIWGAENSRGAAAVFTGQCVPDV